MRIPAGTWDRRPANAAPGLSPDDADVSSPGRYRKKTESPEFRLPRWQQQKKHLSREYLQRFPRYLLPAPEQRSPGAAVRRLLAAEEPVPAAP